MSRRPLALAISAAFISPTAFADVEFGFVSLYGTLHSAVEVISVDSANSTVAPTKGGADDQVEFLGRSAGEGEG